MCSGHSERSGNSDSELLIKSDPPKGKATPKATGIQIRTGNGTKKNLVRLEPPERETRKRRTGKRPRFDRESDTKESDRVGNARPKGKPGGKPERVSTKEASVP
ncbi:hypothetical protein GCM10010207_74330 [Streptomyces atratus]|nr:hypothetical protein GCM10010207_74330 [Streptomyces atratus]